MGRAGVNRDHQVKPGDHGGGIFEIRQCVAKMTDPERLQRRRVGRAKILLYCHPIGIACEQVAPLIVAMCAPAWTETGKLYEYKTRSLKSFREPA